MTVEELIVDAREAVTARRVYGDPYEKNGLTVIPAAAVRGGAGGGGGEEPEKKGIGGGFGLAATPKGAWVITGEKVVWKPAVDVNRIILGGQIVALAALLTVRSIAKARARRKIDVAPILEAIGRFTRGMRACR